ncbi:YadA-like family protein [Gallibacterium anatis]|uniref:Uncharacterized protein n=1 Tax=Gallibacterium anatis TaxID=750 RepID=A0A1A7NUQ4_9PAST|nr:YadA-like family protein [Gallibacterium anatis]OBW93937.1 hypothetical protein QV02_08610 [Gallibacterium anatis]OBX00633.1 hypothetical protein QV03_02005 [Gallibacterium anatis]
MSQVNSANAGVAIGYQALAVGGPNSVAVGAQATANGEQATAFGSFAKAKRQATALGNDVLAYGNSSIAIGNDDIVDARYQDKLPIDTIRNIFGALYGSDGFYSQQTFDNKYISNGSDMRIYSPTYAAKLGAIAIGSRAIAGGEVSTSVGSLSFALADRSTAMGIRTFVAQDAVGGTAIGEQSRVFAPNSIAMGNYTESAAQGSFSYGYNAKAIGQGALAFGYDSAAGAKINGEQYTKLLGFTRGLHALDLFKADGSIDDEKVKQFYAGVDTLIKGGDVNGTQFGGVAQMFTDETLFEKDKSKEYLNIGGKSIYKTSTSTSTFNSSDAAENSFAMGRYAFALRSNAMAFGYSTIADAQSSLAIGSFAHTDYTADNSIAFGVNTYAAGRNNFVAGYSSRSYANDSMALGVGSYIGQRSANSTAIGKVAKVKEDTTNGMAIGNYSEASINNSVALGVNSKTDYKSGDLDQPGWVAKGAIAIPTSAATGLISVGAINNERRITNVASGYADTDAANVAQLRTIDEKFDNRIDSLENGGGVQYQSIDKSNTAGEAAKLGRTLNEVKDYQQYIILEKQWIGFKAREILNGEQVNEASLQAMKDKADKLNEGGRFDSLSSELKALEQSLLAEAKGIDKAKYDDYVSRLTTAFDSDSTRLPNNLTAEQIANLKKGTNYDNDGAQGADSIAFGWKAKTNASGKNAIALGVEAGGENGVSGEDGIAIGTKSKVSGNASIAMGKDNNVSGNNSIAVGTALSIAGNNAGAFGDPSTINYDNSYSVGNNNTIGTATTTETEKGSFVVGNNVEVSADNVFVLGSGESSDNKLKASQANSVYLGSGSAQVGTTASRALGTAYNEVKIGNLTFKTFAGNNPSSIVTIGNDSTTRLLQGVAAGTISAASTDAINGSQLFTTNTALNNTATSLKEIIGGEAKFDTNDQGKITVSNLGGTEKNTVHEAIKQAYDTAMAATTSITNLTQNLSTLESKAITFSGDEGSSSKKLGDTLTIAGGATGTDVNASTNKNIKVIGGTNGLFIQLLPTITGLTKVESGEVQTTTLRLGQGGPTLTADSNNISVNSAKITHLANGEDDGDAVNFSQLKTKADQSTVTNLDTKVTNLTNTVSALNLSFTTDTGDTVKGKVDLDTQSLALKGTQNQIETSSTADGQQATFKLAKAVTDKLDLISTEDGVAKGTQQIQLTDKKSGHTAAQTLGQGETIDFTVTGDGSIDTIASGSQIEVKVTQGGIGTNHLAANAVTTEKLATSAVTSEKLADNAVTTTKISNGNVTKDKLDSTLQTEINKITSLAANTVKLGDGIKETSAQRLDKQGGIKFDIKGGEDITTTANTDNITLSLNKATTVTQNDDKAATAKAVYSAVSDARTKLQLASGETLLSLSGGEESGITGRNYTLSLNQTALTNAIDDKFALKDATNLNEDNVTAWKEKLGIDDLASSVSGITFKGAASGSTDAVVGLNKALDVSGTDIEAKTTAASEGSNAKLELSLSQAVKEKLNQIDTTKGVATADQTIELTADNSTKTGTQRLDKDGGISFAIGGEGAIETNASNGKVTVKVKNSGITEAMLANNAVTTDKIKDTSVTGAKIAEGTIAKSKLDQAVSKEINDATALLDNTITLSGNSGSTTAKRLDSPTIAFNIKGADSGDITTTASASDVTLTLNKATAITNTGNDANRVVTSSAVYSALAAAKPAVVKGDAAQGDTNLLDIVGTKSDGINGDTFKLSLSKKNLVTALQDDFVSAVNGAGIAVFDGQTTPSKKAVNLGEGIQLLGDGYVNAAFDTNEYAYTEDGKQHKAPILKFGVSEQVKTAIDKLNNGEALSGVTFNYKANGDGSDGKVGSVNGETGFDFRGDGSPTSTNKNILISVEPTKQEKAGVIDFSLAEDLRDVKSIGSGSKDASGTEARLSFNSKNGDTAANITASNVKLTGLADGDISKTSSDAITGKQIFSIVGTNNSEHGTIADRLNDLESGLRGTVVYTDKDGNKLVKVTNATGASKFYKATDVAGKHYYNGQWYEATAWNDAEGKPTAEGTGTATVATVNTDNILLSLVSAKDGATITPITLANLASALDLPTSNSATAVTADTAKTKVADLLTKSGADLGRAATVADLQAIAQAGISFLGNEAETNAIHKTLGSVMKIEGKSGATYGSGESVATNYFADNLITYKDGDVLRIAMKTKPTFQGLSLQNGTDPAINLTPGKTNDGSSTLLALSDANNKDVEIKGVAAGTDPNSAVNKAQLDVVANAVGLNGENGINGVDGANGPSGQDGLNGQSLANKVQALRDGLAGTVVYTDAKGVRVMSEDGKYYYPETLTKDMKKANDGLWYAASNVNADGTVTEAGKNSGKKLSELDGADSHKLNASDVILSAVNATGNTTTPISVSNLASVLGAIPTTATTADAKFSDAKAKVGALLAGINPADKDKEPGQQTKVDLDRAATAADLQVLAQAGLAFQGNDEAVVNRALSQTLSIKGEGVTKDNYAAFQSASGNIVVGKDTSEGTLVVKLAKDLNNIHSIGAGAKDATDQARLSFSSDKVTVNKKLIDGINDGEISASSSQAINGSQLYDALDSLQSLLGANVVLDTTTGKLKVENGKKLAGTDSTTFEEAISSLRTQMSSVGRDFALSGNETEGDVASKVVVGSDTLTVKGQDSSGIGTTAKKDSDTIEIAITDKEKFGVHAGKDTINDPQGTSLVQEKAVKGYVDNLADKLGVGKPINGVDGSNGKDGFNGVDGKGIPGADGASPAGKDGLNGTTVANKVQALRDGIAGTVVYTDKDGKRLLVENGKYYKVDVVTGKEKANDGLWYDADKVNADGSVKQDNDNPAVGNTLAELFAGKNDVNLQLQSTDVILSAVNADGLTTAPVTLANLASALDLPTSNSATAVTADIAKTKVTDLLTKSGADLGRAATVADLQAIAQAGISFLGNEADTNAIHKTLGSVMKIEGKSGATYGSGDSVATNYSADNLITYKDGDVLRIAMKTKPTFQGLSLQNGTDPAINLTPGKTNDGSPTLTVSSGTDGNSKDVVLNGIAAGTADNSAVNLAQLNNLRNLIGVGKDGSNGVNGVDGVDGKDGMPAIGQQGVPGKDGQNGQSLVGPAGQDGLNGTTVINKVQALRDGVAGTMVYTDTAGNRLIAENGTFYKTDLVDNYAKANDGLWYAKDKVKADGSVATDVAGQGKSLKELATLAGNEDLIAKSDEVILSAVNADGRTTQPITIANLKDNLVVAEVTPEEQANAENLAKAANGGKDLTDEQKAAVAKALKDQKVNATVASLLANTDTNANELSRAVTLRDLQTVAQAGLSFAGNDSNNPIHQALGTTLLIQGKSGATYSEAVYSADNLITRNDKGTLRIEMKKTPTFDGIILDGKGQDGKDGKDGYIGVDAEGNVVVKNGVDGLAGKDGKDGVDGASKVLTEGSVNASAQLTYKAEGQGYTKDGQKVDKPTVSLADGLNFKGDSNIKTAVNANGEVDITLNKDLTVDSIGGGEGKGKLSFEANNTINANNSRITGIADGKNRGDAVNKGQMDDAIGAVNTNINNIKNEVVNKGMNFATSNNDGKTKSTQTAKLGDTVVVKAGANVDVSEVNKEAEGTFSYTISVKGIPMTYVDADGKPLVQVGDDFYHLKESGAVNFASTATPAGVKVVKDTTKLNDKAVANDQLSTVDVANGEIKNGSQQAVTGGQVADLLGVTVDKDGKVKDGKSGENGIGGTGKNTVSEAISETVKIAKSGNTEVKAGKNVIVTKGTGTNGTTAYTVSMDTSNLEVEKLILGKGDNKTTISVVNQSQYQGSEKAIDVGGTRITNVKDGIDPTDAVNVGQMNKLANATSKAINNVNRRVDHLTQESRAGIAGAMATAGLQQSTERGRTTVSVGSAVFKGESAVALGLSKLSDSGKVGIRISGMTTSNGDTGGSVSVGYTW